MTLRSPIGELLFNIFDHEKKTRRTDFVMCIFRMLMMCTFDYYEIMDVFSSIDTYLPDDIACFLKWSPPSYTLKDLKTRSIRKMIPRWTGTKYHTAPLLDTVQDIQAKMESCRVGIYVYNSNLNIRNARSANDRYVLIIGDRKSLFLDINRKRAFKFDYE